MGACTFIRATLPRSPSDIDIWGHNIHFACSIAQVVSGVVRQSYKGPDGAASEKLQARGCHWAFCFVARRARCWFHGGPLVSCAEGPLLVARRPPPASALSVPGSACLSSYRALVPQPASGCASVTNGSTSGLLIAPSFFRAWALFLASWRACAARACPAASAWLHAATHSAGARWFTTSQRRRWQRCASGEAGLGGQGLAVVGCRRLPTCSMQLEQAHVSHGAAGPVILRGCWWHG